MEASTLPRPRPPAGGARDRLADAAAVLAAHGVGAWLLAALLAAVAYAAFFSGAIDVPEESRLQIGIAGLVVIAAAGLAVGALTLPPAPLAWGGVGLLGLLGIWSVISGVWSVLPDESWLAANRTLTYAGAAGLALVAAASTRRAPRLTALGIAALGLTVSLYALGGKLAPGVDVLGIDLDHTADFSRLRAPIEYWNGLGLFAVLAAPAGVWLAADRGRSPEVRIGAVGALVLLVVTAGLTYSRGAVIAFVVVVAVMVAAGPDRLRRLCVAILALIGAAAPLAFGFSRSKLTTDNLAVAERTGDGILLALVLAGSLLVVALAARAAIRAEGRMGWGPGRERVVWRGLGGLLALALAAGTLAAATSDRGLGGTVSHQVDEFTRAKRADLTDPGRLLSTSGSNRWIWWGEALGAFWDRPVEGWGAGSFPATHRLYRDNNLDVRQPHSVPLQFLAETGLVGGLLALAGLGLVGLAVARGVRAASGDDRSARLALAAAAAAWAVHTLYDWDWDIPAVTLPALIAAAVAAAPSPSGPAVLFGARQRGGRGAPGAAARLAGVGLATAAALTLAVSALLPALSEERRLAALGTAERAGEDAAGLQRAAAQAALARRLNPVSVEPLFTASTIAARRGRLAEALYLLARAARLQPDNIRVWRRLIEFQLGAGETRLLARSVREAVRVDPHGGAGVTAGAVALLVTSPYRSPTATGTPLPPLQRPR